MLYEVDKAIEAAQGYGDVDVPEELKDVPTVSASLREALNAVDRDRDFLLKGGVMSEDLIDAYIDLKKEELDRFETHPHPVEFDMYYKA